MRLLSIIVLGRQNVLETKGVYENDYEGRVVRKGGGCFIFSFAEEYGKMF